MLTMEEQKLTTNELKLVLKGRRSAKQSLNTIDYTDIYVTKTRKEGTPESYTVQVMDKPSEFRTMLESIGVSKRAKSEVINKVKDADVELGYDIALLSALIKSKS